VTQDRGKVLSKILASDDTIKSLVLASVVAPLPLLSKLYSGIKNRMTLFT